MSGERMTSRAEADILKTHINQCIDGLEAMGFARGQIGAAMAGISLALVQVHNGHEAAVAIIGMARNALDADALGRH